MKPSPKWVCSHCMRIYSYQYLMLMSKNFEYELMFYSYHPMCTHLIKRQVTLNRTKYGKCVKLIIILKQSLLSTYVNILQETISSLICHCTFKLSARSRLTLLSCLIPLFYKTRGKFRVWYCAWSFSVAHIILENLVQLPILEIISLFKY